MTTFKYGFLIMFFFFFLPITIFIQAQEIMYLKQEFTRPLENKVVNSRGEMIDYSMLLGTRDGTGKPWIVFSDRNYNKTYQDADVTSNLKISNIKFMEKFFVIDEDGKFVKIAQGTSETDGRIKVGNVYGWIPKANLLLWTHCIYNDEELTKKALVLNNIDMMEEEEKNNMQKLAKFYAHPDMHKKDFLNTSYFFKIYYIYKVLPDAVLIGKRKNFETSKSGDTILGWFSPKNITFWNSRIYIEHNSRGEAVEERAKYNDEYLFFDTADAAKVYRDGGMPSAKHIIMKMKDYEYDRRAGNVMRFPVLSENDGILKVVAIAEPEKNEEEIEIKKPKKKKRRQKNAKNVLLEAENKNLIPAFQGAKVAYTVLKRNNNTEHNLYEYVLFLDNSELAEIISLLRRFTESDLTHDELLSHIENTWHMILGRYEGEDIKEYTDWTLAQIHEKVFGLPMQASFLNSIKLKQVKDLDRETANKHIQFFDYSYNVLNIILRRGGNYDYSFINDRDIYYWILERELP